MLKNNDGHRFIFRHTLGSSFSKMTFEAWKELTSKFGYKIKHVELGDELLVFDISNSTK